jgi:glutamyl-tRNA synthetase
MRWRRWWPRSWQKRGMTTDERLPAICGLFKDRCDTTVALADWAQVLRDRVPSSRRAGQHVTDAVKPALPRWPTSWPSAWDKAGIAAAIKEVLAEHGLKMPQLAMPVRVLVMGTAQTPSLDAVLALASREKVLAALAKPLKSQAIIQGSEITGLRKARSG